MSTCNTEVVIPSTHPVARKSPQHIMLLHLAVTTQKHTLQQEGAQQTSAHSSRFVRQPPLSAGPSTAQSDTGALAHTFLICTIWLCLHSFFISVQVDPNISHTVFNSVVLLLLVAEWDATGRRRHVSARPACSSPCSPCAQATGPHTSSEADADHQEPSQPHVSTHRAACSWPRISCWLAPCD